MVRNKRKTIVGKVIRKSSEKTIAVAVERRYKHLRYNKTVKAVKKYQVHCTESSINIGDVVEIGETRHISKSKNWCVRKVVMAGTR